jgi:DNA adenine methylase
MELLLDGDVDQVHLNDSSFQIYAFWKSVIAYTDELCALIAEAPLTIDQWRECREVVRDPKGHDELDVGFSTFMLNRCNRSGVLTGGVIGGFEQQGTWRIDARFPRDALIRRIQAIGARSASITLRNWDAEHFMAQYVSRLPENTLLYCDPPYYDKTNRLYLDRYTNSDHERLAASIQGGVQHHWIVSYDAHPNIIGLYRARRAFVYDLQYSASRSYKGREVFVFADTLSIPRSSALACIQAAQWVA